MGSLICLALWVYLLLIFARIVTSWVPPTPGSTYARVAEFLHSATEPVLGPVRAMLPPMRMGAMGLDLSPIIVFFVISILQRLVC